MDERPKNGWQAWLAGALFLGVLAAALLIGRPTKTPPRPATATPTRVVPTEVLPKAQPPLYRGDLIKLGQKAASAFATGGALQNAGGDLAGRRFELRLPFGCTGAAREGAAVTSGWSYDPKKESLRAFVAPQGWSDTEWLRTAIGDGVVDRAEGFVIERPWILEPACPRPARMASVEAGPDEEGQSEADTPAAPEEKTAPTPADKVPELAVVELFTADAPRSAARGDRGYVAVVKRPPEKVDPNLWFTLVLSGRLATFPGGNSVRCWGDALATRPRCLLAVEIDHAAIVDRDGLELAEWAQ